MKMFLLIMILVYGDMPDGRIMSCQKFPSKDYCAEARNSMLNDFDVALGDTLYISKCMPASVTRENDAFVCEDILNTLNFKKDMTILGKKR